MKINQIPSVAQGNEQQQSIRSIKMKVNQTPGGRDGLEAQPVAETQEINNNVDSNENNKVAEEATEPLSPQLAALARQRRALQQERRALDEKMKAFEQLQSQGSDSIAKARIKSETLKVLEEAGVSYDELAQQIMANPQNAELNALKAKIEALEKGVDQKLTERDQQQRTQVLNEMRGHAKQLVADGEAFALVRAYGRTEDAIQLIERTYDESGEVLDVAEALRLVEDELYERQKNLSSVEKLRQIYQPAEPTPQAPQRAPMRTITNQHTASIPLGRKERALAAWAGTLRK